MPAPAARCMPTPWRITAGRVVAYSRASATTASASSPVARAVASGVHAATSPSKASTPVLNRAM